MPPSPATKSDDPAAALRAAVELVGSQGAMARLLDVSQPTVWAWIAKNKALPPQHVLKVEAATGIPKERLRPDMYETVLPALPSSNRQDGTRA